MTPPRVGITYRFEEKLIPYAAAARAVGLDPVPLLPPGPASLAGLDGLIISGGDDIDPALYGQTPHPETEEPDAARDAMELRLLHLALEADLPVLCICRGMQLFNVALGGDLIQHLPATELHRQRGVTDVHAVETLASTRLAQIFTDPVFEVNSRHHQAVGKVAPGLVASLVSSDGLVEGLELPGKRFALGVQWHPEDRVPSHGPDTALFQAFARSLKP